MPNRELLELSPPGPLKRQLGLERGSGLREAVINSGLIRSRPIILTALAVVIGGLVMVQDPIFQGLGVALISGAIVATGLTLIAIPLLYFEMEKGSEKEA